MRIGKAESLPDQIDGDRRKPTYRQIDEVPHTNISGLPDLATRETRPILVP
jgi:hypothetical protein